MKLLATFLLLSLSGCGCSSAPDYEFIGRRVVIAEAAGESLEGKVAVAEVLRNRNWETDGFTGMRRQDFVGFLWHQPRSVHNDAVEAVHRALMGSNTVKGATHFYSTDYPAPYWVKDMRFVTQIGKHRFYKGRTKGA